jgi:hypothetical protein
MFDDGAGPPAVHPYSRGIRVALNTGSMTARLAAEYGHDPRISSDFEGNVEQLAAGDVFMGWGQQPYFSEDNSHGQQIFDARFLVPTSTYRAYRFTWNGQPTNPPAAAVGPGPSGTTEVYASWNGATGVSAWRILTGSSPSALFHVDRGRPNGFETGIAAHSQLPYFQAQALSSSGAVLGTSAVVKSPPHLALFGRTSFVSSAGTGAVPAACVTAQACSVATTISVGRTVIASTGREAIGAGSGRLLFFTLNGTGRSMLAHAAGRRLAVSVSARDKSGLSAGASLALVPFTSQGAGPHRSVTPSGALQLIGSTDFVSAGGTGGILLGCFSTSPCWVSGHLSVGQTTIATTRPEFIGPGELGYLIFSLSSAGRSMLAHAPGNQLDTTVSLSAGTAKASGQIALVRFS